jgi:Insertion element 4 transposase N-terminal/Transposase DDE domain
MGSSSKQQRPRKREQRDSILPEGHGARILDRLLLLEHVIPHGEVLQVLKDTGCLDARRCTLTFEVTCWLVLAMGVLTDLPIQQVFKASRRLYPDEDTPHRSSLCRARQRLGVAPLRLLFERIARPLADLATPGAFYKGLRLMGLDGVLYTVPDSAANASAFGYPQGGRGRGAFPQVRKLSLVELGTHAEVAFAVKGLKQEDSAEQKMVPALLRHLRAGMLLLWDRGFLSYNLWQAAQLRCDLLARVKARLTLRPIESLPDGSYLAKLYPSSSDRTANRWGIVVRVIRYTHNDPRRVDCGKDHVLLTTLLDAVKSPAQELIVLYHERWEIELTFDEQKTHQTAPRATKPAHLRSETPLGVIQEIYALAIGHYVTRSLMAEAAAQQELDPDRLSFLGCLQILRTRMPECPGDEQERAKWMEVLFSELSKQRTDKRRNRINPRVVRIKMSKFKKKRPEHRGIKVLERPFVDVIVMLPVSQPATCSRIKDLERTFVDAVAAVPVAQPAP